MCSSQTILVLLALGGFTQTLAQVPKYCSPAVEINPLHNSCSGTLSSDDNSYCDVITDYGAVRACFESQANVNSAGYQFAECMAGTDTIAPSAGSLYYPINTTLTGMECEDPADPNPDCFTSCYPRPDLEACTAATITNIACADRDECTAGVRRCMTPDVCENTPDPCGNGTCADITGTRDNLGYTCDCDDGYMLNPDERAIPRCILIDCGDPGMRHYANYMVDDTTLNATVTYTCHPYHATRMNGTTYTAFCNEMAMWENLDDCLPVVNPCEVQFASFCQNGGICIMRGPRPTCLCQPGFEGVNCQRSRRDLIIVIVVAVLGLLFGLLALMLICCCCCYFCRPGRRAVFSQSGQVAPDPTPVYSSTSVFARPGVVKFRPI